MKKLWLLSNNNIVNYDTCDSCIVAAETEQEAVSIHPSGDIYGAPCRNCQYVQEHMCTHNSWSSSYSWASNPEDVNAKLIGTAEDAGFTGVLLASFHAG